MTSGPGSQLSHSLSYPRHGALTRPAVQEVEALAFLLPQLTAHTLVQVTAEKVKALLAIVELDSSRLIRVQLKTQTLQDDPDTLFGLLTALLSAAHHHEVIAVAHQCSQWGTVARPQCVEHVQVDV